MTVGIIGLGLIGGSLAKAFRRDPSVTVLGVGPGPLHHRVCPDRPGHPGPPYRRAPGGAGPAPPGHLSRGGGGAHGAPGAPAPVPHHGHRLRRHQGEGVPGGLPPGPAVWLPPSWGATPWRGPTSPASSTAGPTSLTGHPWCWCPPPLTTSACWTGRKKLLAPVGFGRVSITTADKHDQRIAFTSQMAHVISNAYIKAPPPGGTTASPPAATRTSPGWPGSTPPCGPSFSWRTRRICSSELDTLIGNLNQYKNALEAEDFPTLCRLLDEGRKIKEEVDGK